jgi:hypothetical protein
LELLLEHTHALAQRRERKPEGEVLGLAPARAQPELDPAARDLVDARHDLGELGGMPEGRWRDERAKADGAGHGRETTPCSSQARASPSQSAQVTSSCPSIIKQTRTPTKIAGFSREGRAA